MIKFLIKGIFRDRHRSLFPMIIIAAGAFLTTFLYSWMLGVLNEIIDGNARFETGHVKIMTRAYEKISSQVPNDLALNGVDSILIHLKKYYPEYDWVARIKFGGLLDVPDENGETRDQGPVMGIAIDLLGSKSTEPDRLGIPKSIVRGQMPRAPGEILVSEELTQKLNIRLGEKVTLISATATGGMAVYNFTVAGTLIFGIAPMDRGTMIADTRDIQYALDMENSAGEILGFSKDGLYQSRTAMLIRDNFNRRFSKTNDEFSPVMVTLEEQGGLGDYLQYARSSGFIVVFIFVVAMSIVLWNTSLMSGIRRYGEIGVRLAIGESKDHIYRTLLAESVVIGIAGSIIGTALGLLLCYYLQEVGWDISGIFQNSSLMVQNVIRARITPTTYYIGFIPGMLATLLGTAIAGVGIFKRQTATLFKELET